MMTAQPGYRDRRERSVGKAIDQQTPTVRMGGAVRFGIGIAGLRGRSGGHGHACSHAHGGALDGWRADGDRGPLPACSLRSLRSPKRRLRRAEMASRPNSGRVEPSAGLGKPQRHRHHGVGEQKPGPVPLTFRRASLFHPRSGGLPVQALHVRLSRPPTQSAPPPHAPSRPI